VTPAETRHFAERLMREVWEPFGHAAVPDFYHADVIGHHRAQTLCLEDIVERLKWDVLNFAGPGYDIRELIAEAEKFAIRFIFACTLTRTGQRFTTEVTYFYRLRDGKVAEFWLLSDTDFDYKQRP
jgi:predicted ester cyclase